MLSAVDRHLDDAIALRHELHADPELGHEEHATSERIRAALAPWVEPELMLGTGIIARIGGTGTDGVGLRAELDGLPLSEATGAPFAATNGRMHACGHDVHMAALVAACRAAADVGIARPLIAVFQPSEERYPSGAEQLVAEGVLERHRVGAMLAVHLHPQPARDALALGEGAINASSDEFELVIEGNGGHGAYPHKTCDPVLALSHIIVALQQIVARRVNPLHSAVVGIGTVRAEGAANIVPSEARATGTLRCLQSADREALQEMVAEIAAYTAKAHACRAHVTFTRGEPALVNTPALLAHVERALGPSRLRRDQPMRSCGADDFGFYAERVASAMLFLGIDDDEDVPGLHHPRFLPPDTAVGVTARALLAAYIGGCDYLDERDR
jgi:amidohydrolase